MTENEEKNKCEISFDPAFVLKSEQNTWHLSCADQTSKLRRKMQFLFVPRLLLRKEENDGLTFFLSVLYCVG